MTEINKFEASHRKQLPLPLLKKKEKRRKDDSKSVYCLF